MTPEEIEREDAGFVKEDERDQEIKDLKHRIDALVDKNNDLQKEMDVATQQLKLVDEETDRLLEINQRQKESISAQSATIAAMKERIEALTVPAPDPISDPLQGIGAEIRRILDTEYFGGDKETGGGDET